MTFEVPALHGDDVLGFLAAVGLVALSEQGEVDRLSLGWSSGYAPRARISGPASIEALGEQLRSAFERLRTSGGVLPGVDSRFPVGAQHGGQDPMRMTADRMAAHFEAADRAHIDGGNPWMGRWLLALAAQAAVKDKKRGDVQLTPFYAPTGQMKLRTSIFEKTMEAVERVGGPADALTGWRRTSYDGANFDERAKRDAVFSTAGEPDNQGAPSATWLAALGMRFFPIVDDGRQATAVGWCQVQLYPGYTRRAFTWPVWAPLLDPPAVRTLLAHPAVAVRSGPTVGRSDALRALGVVAVYGANRRTLTQGDGPLGPTVRIWPR